MRCQHTSNDAVEDLCNRMADFFTEKIWLKILQENPISIDPDAEFPEDAICFMDYSPVTEEEVERIVRKCASKSCCLDPIPTHIVKECLDVLLPVITNIIDKSFASATV